MLKITLSLIMITALFSLLCAPLQAQNNGTLEGIALDKLGILNTPGTGARPFSMGGAYTAISDDAFALLYNPAGLAQVRRIELSIGMHQLKNDITNKFLGYSAENTCSSTSIGHIALIYPYPTYRGGLALGFGVFRAGSSELESFKNGYLEDIQAVVQNKYLQSGNLYQYHIGAGMDISPNISLGAGIVIWDESIDFTDEINYNDPGSLAVWNDDVSLDVDGFSMNLGLLYRANEFFKAGLMITTPVWLSLNGDGITNYDGTYKDGSGGWTVDPDYGVIDENYTLPMKFRGGIAFFLPNFTLACDVSYTDFTQVKRNGKPILDSIDFLGRHMFNDVLEYNAGLEFTVPGAPMRLRCGYSYRPLAIASIEEIGFIEEDYPTSYVGDVTTVRQRQFFTFGVGTILSRVLSVDATLALGSFERETPNLDEKRDITEFLLSTAYRF